MLKFPVDGGIVTIRSTILIPAECATVTTSSKEILKEAEVRHEKFKVAIHPNFSDQEVAIGGTLSAKGQTELCSLMKENLDIFAWQLSDMTGVPRSVAEHRLNIREGYLPVRQKKKGQSLEHAKAILAEVQKLVEAGIMKEVYYHDWLSNPVMVKKHDEPYEEKTAFHTSHRVYCYTKMPFGLKNAGAIYQWLVDKAFDNQVGQNIEVYIDDLVIKSHTETEMLRDIDETFCTFLSKSAEKSLPQFKTLKKCLKKSDFHWKPEAGQAFKQLKQHLSKLPMLVAPKPKEELIVYLFASHGAISAVLMTERDKVQMPVYFVSRLLQGPKLNYTPMEKLVLSLVFTAKRTSMKEHILADFLVEKPDEAPPDTSVFTASNNEAEYEALIAGLRIATQMGVRNVHVSVDSKLVANQVLGTFVAKEENMIKYLAKAKSMISSFANFSISQVPRSKNKKADALSKIASTIFAHLSKHVLVEVLKEKSIQEAEVETVVEEEGPTWMTSIMEYLKDGTLLDDRKKSQVFNSLYGLFYEVDRGESRGDNHWESGEEVRVGQHMKHPQSNGLVERANRSLGKGIKARLGEGNKNWIKEIPHVLWAYRTMIKSSHGNTPFSLTYGTEAFISAEIGMPTYRTAVVDAVHNDEELRLNLDLLEERRERAAIREAKAKLKMTKYYNDRVRVVTFRPGDFVYRSNKASHVVDGGKLGPKWEGPYEVTEALRDGAYMLRSMDGTVLSWTWDIANLKKCYL
ncbi:reverse transcriptase domain-containing protein [Tanacetum coccineum]|uniref:Reverse transcriptase domain-containing protein n=1 Tax=Tanacetum coccineum TaxID=301880 RepID=A0ABQ5GAJ5_9ASTR